MNKIIYIICFLLLQLVCFGQIQPSLKSVPQEKIFLHINTAFLLAGNTLNYKVYCINNQTNKLSNLSKVVYVELIDETRTPIIKHKLQLKGGETHGDFYIPASVNSGNYKIIAYTKWMLNKDFFYDQNLLIVNPFSSNQSKIISNKDLNESNSINHINNSVIKDKDLLLSLKTTIKTYKPREKVNIEISALTEKKSFGKYSISVRKKTPIKSPEIRESKKYSSLYVAKNNVNLKGSSFLIPEFRGALIQGTITNINNNNPILNKKIALSIPGIEPIFKISNTNEDGKFFFSINEYYDNTSALIYALGDNPQNYKINIKQEQTIDYSILEFNKFYISEADKVILLEESLSNQIENSYKTVKKDSVLDTSTITPFYGSLAKDYYLDDYKRFSSLKETFVEVINDAWITRKDGNHIFVTKRTPNEIDFKLPTMLFVDGILIENHNDIINYDAKNIKKISVLLGRYVYGVIMFDGLISIKTKEGNFKNSFKGFKEINLTNFFPSKKFFSPDYTNPQLYSRIPDYRQQLFWEPNVTINSQDKKSLSFFTSDNLGEYVISLEGFTHEGMPVSIKEIITVK